MHDEVRELLGVYALDALEDDERASVAAHLKTCPECRAEVEQHLEVVAMLGGVDQEAPANSWEGIAEQIAGREPGAVVPLVRRPRLLLAAAAVLILLLGGSLIAQTIRLSDAQSVSAAGLDDVVAEVLKDDTTMLMTLTSEGDASALVAFRPDGTGYLVRHSLPAVSSDRTYQLWAVVDGTVISAGVLGSDPGIVPFRIDPRGLEALAITEEVAGGVVVSENDAIALWLAT
jgi:predicted anti-sigma-YlaC factor YlaD